MKSVLTSCLASLNSGVTRALRGLAVLALSGALAASAQTAITWANTGTDFASGASWSGGTAPADDLTSNLATFANPTATTSPNLAANRSVAGVVFSDGAGAYTLGGSGVLTLGASGINNGATAFSVTINTALALGTSSTLINNSTSPLNLNGNLDLGANNLQLGGSGSIARVAGNITGTGGVTLTGSGFWSLSGSDYRWSGGTVVNDGAIEFTGNALVPTGNVTVASTVAGDTATFEIHNTIPQTIGSLTLGGSTTTSRSTLQLGTGASLTLGGDVTFDATSNPLGAQITGTAATLVLGGNRTFNVGNTTSAGNDLMVTPAISGGTFSLTKAGAGAMSLQNSADAWSGATIITGGTLAITNNALPSGTAVTVSTASNSAPAILQIGTNTTSSIGTLTFGAGTGTSNATNSVTIASGSSVTLGGTVTYDATNNPGIASISGAGTLNLGGARTFDIGDSTATTRELVVQSVVAGAFSLTKTGAGTLRLSGANTYSGGTIVTAGVLQVTNTSGSGVGIGAVDIRSGATVSGNGTISGATTIEAGGKLAPSLAGTASVLTFTNGLTLVASSVTSFQLGTASDKVVVSGSQLAGPASGTVALNLTDGGGFGVGQYTLFDYSTGGTTTSSFDASDFVLGTTPVGYNYHLDVVNNDTLVLTVTAAIPVPEPATYAALLGAASLGLVIVRRRRRNTIAA